jgi:hypothetical protein
MPQTGILLWKKPVEEVISLCKGFSGFFHE